MGLGILFHRKSTSIAFKKGLTMINAITYGMTKTEISNLTVAELRVKISNQSRGNKNLLIWSIISLLVFFLPFFIVATVILGYLEALDYVNFLV